MGKDDLSKAKPRIFIGKPQIFNKNFKFLIV